jgi:polyhydroxyalkanoate synthesis regulator protein
MLRIKKYKNRHMYLCGKYITFDTLEKIIKSGEPFMVYNHLTNEDVTNDTLREMLRDKKYHLTNSEIKNIIYGDEL